jgi:hypothetical protein
MGAERWAFFLRFRMNAAHFDRFTRLLADPGFPRTISWDVEPGLSRRAFIAGALAFLRLGGNRDTAAGPGCKNVGRRCQRARQCCSGICRGGKRKRCKAHDSGGAVPVSRAWHAAVRMSPVRRAPDFRVSAKRRPAGPSSASPAATASLARRTPTVEPCAVPAPRASAARRRAQAWAGRPASVPTPVISRDEYP